MKNSNCSESSSCNLRNYARFIVIKNIIINLILILLILAWMYQFRQFQTVGEINSYLIHRQVFAIYIAILCMIFTILPVTLLNIICFGDYLGYLFLRNWYNKKLVKKITDAMGIGNQYFIGKRKNIVLFLIRFFLLVSLISCSCFYSGFEMVIFVGIFWIWMFPYFLFRDSGEYIYIRTLL
ncbi:Uncharacterised protein [Acetobacterium wieringae]|nr:Uncharacterised protein [Acetobacterium wieringae]